MPGGFPLGLELSNAQNIGVSLTNGGTSVTGGNGTPGSWAQLIASTTYDIDWLEVFIFPTTATSNRQLVDIGVGAGGSEKVVVQQLMSFSNTGRNTVGYYSFPLSIPAGTRIAARSQNNAAADVLAVKVNGYSGAFTMMEGAAGVDAIGVSATEGTTLTGNVTAGNKGSYTPLIASTNVDYMGFFVEFDTASAADWYLVDVAIGAGGSEIIIVPDAGVTVLGAAATPQVIGPYFIPIKAGTRIAMRICAIAASAPTINTILYGIYA